MTRKPFVLFTAMAAVMIAAAGTAAAEPAAADTFTISAPHIEMVFVNSGTFKMGCRNLDGSGCFTDERPRHDVKVNRFLISRYPVTQLQWRSVMGENPANFRGDSLPVEQVSWEDAQEFIKRLNSLTKKKYRLPTEAEWEYAAQGGHKTSGEQFFGHRFLADVAWYDYNSRGRTMNAGAREPNELGLYDVLGNVWEWVSDWYDNIYYRESPVSNPRGPRNGLERVYRGCSFNSGESVCRVSVRNYAKPDYRMVNLGFRLAQTP